MMPTPAMPSGSGSSKVYVSSGQSSDAEVASAKAELNSSKSPYAEVASGSADLSAKDGKEPECQKAE